MRYTASELEGYAIKLSGTMKQLENDIMADIVRRIKKSGDITRSADWQIYRMHELGESKRAIKKHIKEALKLSNQEVNHLYKDVIRKGYAEDESLYKYKGKPYIPFEENIELQQLITATALQTQNEMKNITQSLGFSVKNPDGSIGFKYIADYYQQTLDKATLGIATGAFDYNTVLKKAVAELTNSGLRTVNYASGWRNRVDVATRRAVMTGFNQIVARVNDENAERLGTNYFEVSWHGGARPTHQKWQGRVYSREELEEICGLGEVTGLCGANCYHSYWPFFKDIDKPIYTEKQLAEMNKKENTPVEYNGKKYTKYEALQRQRRLETTMRAQRQEIKLLQDGGADEDDITIASGKYQTTSSEYTRFSKAMSLPQQRERVTIDGLGDIGQGKYTKSTKTDSKSVANSGGSGIIKSEEYRDNDTVYKPVTNSSIENVSLMNVFTADDISDIEAKKQAGILNARYQEASKDLLREVQKHPVGTEVSIVYDENMNPIKGCGYIVGKIGSVKIDNPDVPYYALHNHPSGETFSPEDLLSFTLKPNQLGIGALGNNSNAYVMLKSGNSDNKRYYDFIFEKISNKNFYNGYSYLEIKDGKLNISKLNDEQISELKDAITKLGDECSKAGENFGYKYIYK